MPETARHLDPQLLRRLARLDLVARTIVEGFYAGRRASKRRGFSVEFSDYREYAPGDDPTGIDWTVWARTDRYYLRQHEAETNLRCTICLDRSASMDWRSSPRVPTKAEYATALAAALAWLLVHGRDRVGLLTFDARVRTHLAPKARRSHLWRLLERLDRAPCEGATDVASALEAASRLLRRRGMVVVISDLLTRDIQGAVRALRHLAFRGQDVVVLQILDERELDPVWPPGAELEDPETGRVAPAPDASARAYRREILRLLDAYRGEAARGRIDYALLSTSTPFDHALGAFLRARAARY